MITQQGERLILQGRLNIETVPAVFDAGLRYLRQQDCVIDFSQVEQADSSAVSLLLGWSRAAVRASKKLTVTGLPDDLQSLARLYGVETMLPTAS